MFYINYKIYRTFKFFFCVSKNSEMWVNTDTSAMTGVKDAITREPCLIYGEEGGISLSTLIYAVTKG